MLGTAGHVDHGKTALVMALTGVDTDRLPEEKSRGISIELGFAQLQLGTRTISLIDVPGHERFVRHMVAGAGGIDAFLLCVAADDGVMPQTREHLAVLRLLGVRHGVVAITKCDLADPDRAMAQVRELVGDGVAIVPVSAPKGIGIDDLTGALSTLVDGVQRRRADGPARLFVDRGFTVRGAGTVVTGTLWGEPIATGERVVIQPTGVASRVRQIQVHDSGAMRADGGRVALNLAGISRDEVPRGSVVVRAADTWEPTHIVDVALEWLPDEAGPLTSRRRLQVFHGTSEVSATCIVLEPTGIAPGAQGYVQLRLDAPLVAMRGDHVVLRSAARRTVGGAVIIDPSAQRHGRSAAVCERLRAMEGGEEPTPAVAATPDRASAQPAPAGAPAPVGRDARRVHDHLAQAGVRPPAPHQVAADLGMRESDVRDALAALSEVGLVTYVGEVWFATDALNDAVATAVRALADGPRAIGELRDAWAVGRKHALAIAAYMDRCGVTRRVGDHRVLRRSAINTETS